MAAKKAEPTTSLEEFAEVVMKLHKPRNLQSGQVKVLEQVEVEQVESVPKVLRTYIQNSQQRCQKKAENMPGNAAPYVNGGESFSTDAMNHAAPAPAAAVPDQNQQNPKPRNEGVARLWAIHEWESLREEMRATRELFLEKLRKKSENMAGGGGARVVAKRNPQPQPKKTKDLEEVREEMRATRQLFLERLQQRKDVIIERVARAKEAFDGPSGLRN